MQVFKQRFILLSLCIVALFIPALSTMAQDATLANSITLTETAINDLLRSGQQQEGNDFFLDFQLGQMVFNLVVTGRRGNTTTFGLTIVPSVSPQQTLQLDAPLLTVNDVEIPLDESPLVQEWLTAINQALTENTNGGAIQSVSVNDAQARLTWINADPNTPTVNIIDTQWSFTFTEASINAMEWVTNPTGEFVSDVSVDLQAGQGVITVNRTIEPTTVTYTIIPTVVNDRVAWQVRTEAGLERSVANTLATVWRAYFTGIYGDSSMKNALVTDNSITFTWDVANAGTAQRENPVVTYTVNEAEMNEVLAQFTTEDLIALSVDIQPERVILDAVGLDAQGNQYTGAISMLPNLSNGRFTWVLEGFSVNGITINGNETDTDTPRAITDGLNGYGNNATVTDYTLSDTEMTITVRYP